MLIKRASLVNLANAAGANIDLGSSLGTPGPAGGGSIEQTRE
ncbi:MAG: hypothetical protein ABJA82_19050 [Myxococcales bacterium]